MKSSKKSSNKRTYPQETQSFWNKHLEQMEESPLSKAAYCRLHHLNYDRTIYWQRCLRGKLKKKLLPVKVTNHIGIPSKAQVDKSAPSLARLEQRPAVLGQLQLTNGASLSITSEVALNLLLDKVIKDAAFL